MTAADHRRFTADAFLAWALAQPSGARYELISGEAIAMAPERAGHALVKHAMARLLEHQVEHRRLPCEVFPDGMSVRVDDSTVYEPDAILRCGKNLDRGAIEVPDPLIVVEVLSPSTRGRDTGAKLEGYFRLPTVRHYLIVKTDTRALIHHARAADGTIETSIHSSGAVTLDPPGIELDVAQVFARL